jgi:peroxidase
MDPSLDKSYADELKTKCKSLADTTTIVAMDPGSALTFDSHYFSNLKSHRGLFQSDAALLTDSISKNIVEKQLKENSFFDNFKNSIQQDGRNRSAHWECRGNQKALRLVK